MPPGPQFNASALAFKAWSILTACAAAGQPVQYGQLAKALGIHHRPVKYVLSEIQDCCLRDKVPPLTILVEDQKGNVGVGFIAWDADDIPTGRARVYAENWAAKANPFAFAASGATPDSIAKAIAAGHTTPSQAYALVKQRGMAQVIFRKALLKVYDGQCAMSDARGAPLLQAAHIIPWGAATPSLRLDTKNGILLSLAHHRMYDLGWIQIQTDYGIRVNGANFSDQRLSPSQLAEFARIEGTKIRLPRDRQHWPDKILLARRLHDPKLQRQLRAERVTD